MTIGEIQRMPQCGTELCSTEQSRFPRVHESLFRSYQILEKVKYLLEKGTAPLVVSELIDEMEEYSRP